MVSADNITGRFKAISRNAIQDLCMRFEGEANDKCQNNNNSFFHS